MKPTPEQADEFERYIRKWQSALNLHDWRVERSTKKASRGAMAEVHASFEDRLAAYRLGDFGDTPVTPLTLEQAACHELLHVLLRELTGATDETRMAAEHRVVNTLERLLVPTVGG